MSEPIFTSQLKSKEKSINAADNKGHPIRKYQTHVFLLIINEKNLTSLSHSKISNACLFAYINEQTLTRFSHSKISYAYDCGMGGVCHQFRDRHGTSC